MNWDDLRLFLRVAEHRSLSAAAGPLKLSVPTLARRLEALEHALATRLVVRTPRGVALTEAGRRLADRASAFWADAAELERFALGLAETPRPAFVRVSATEPVVAELLAPRLPGLLAAAPGTRVELRVENSLAAIALNDADVAVRLVPPAGRSLVARRLAPLAMGVYGAADTVARLTRAGALDWSAAALLTYDDSYGPIPERAWVEAAGLGDNVVARVASTRGLVAAVEAGAGLAVLPVVLAARRGLVRVDQTPLPPPPPRAVWLVRHRDAPASVRAVTRWITAVMGRV